MVGSNVRAVFLDLQGTLGGAGLGDVRDFSFYPCAIQAIRLINESAFLAIVITNQSHIGKGLFTYAEYEQRMSEIKASMIEHGAHLDAVYCCPHAGSDGCDCRKPLPGLIRQAAMDYGINVSESYVIGDMGSSDMQLSQAVGAKGVLVLTGVGRGSMTAYRHTWAGIEPAYVADNVLQAVEWIMEQEAVRAEHRA